MLKILAVSAGLALVLSGCATRADSVAPVSISASEYSTLGCNESRAQRDVAQQKADALAKRQDNAATADAAAVFLVGLPLGSVFGGNVAGALAQAKGEALALERHTRTICDAEAARLGSPAATPDATTTTRPR